MLNNAVLFFVIALIASALGFGGVAGLSAQVGWFFAIVAVIIIAFSLITGRRSLLSK